MSRGDKNYSEKTHKALKEGTKAKQKAVSDMIGAKKKLHEMVEALIGGDSKAAAAALHEYLQQKTRAILGEHDELDMDFGDEEGMEGGEEHGEGDVEGECPECHCDPCECEDHDEHDVEDHDGEEMVHDEHDSEEPMVGESAEAKKTHMKKLGPNAKDLDPKVKGTVKFATKGKAKLTKPHNNAAPDLDRKVKGDIKFGTKGSAKLTHPHNNAAPGLDRKVKGTVKF